MLLKHSAQYTLSLGLSGLVNFLAIAIYTRLLSPDEYGRYILVVAGVGLFNVIFFQWLSLALFRFLPANMESPRQLLSTVLAGFSALALLTGGLGLLLCWLWPDPTWKGLILLAVPLLWMRAFFDLVLSLSNIKLLAMRYGLMKGFQALIALAVGVMLILWGLGAYGPLTGLLLGMLLSIILWGREEWMGLSFKISQPLLTEILRYGLPLSFTFALGFVVSSSDRFLIAWFLGEAPAGLYSAAYDLGQQSLTLLMTVVNLAAYPLAVRALEQKEGESLQEHLRQNGTLLMVIAFPAAVGLAVLAPNVSAVLLGASFREDAAHLLPWVSLAILFAGMRSYHFDLAFQLGKHTMGQVWVVGAAALLNIILNIWWIPSYGLMGAAYATFAAYLLAFLLSAILGRRSFAIPIPYSDGFKIAMASLFMGLALWLSLEYQGLYALITQVLLGGVVYLILLGLLNVEGSRTILLRRLLHMRDRYEKE
jgi:O-antigen/teichoic acid export membrane protein